MNEGSKSDGYILQGDRCYTIGKNKSEDGLYVTINVSLEDTEDDAIILKLAAHDSIGGSYEVENLPEFKYDVWLCNVVHYLFGEHPDMIYFKVAK